MKTEIKYFGTISDIYEVNKEQIEFTENSTLSNLKKLIESKHIRLNKFMYHLAVNDYFLDDNPVIAENDNVIVLPPYAGG